MNKHKKIDLSSKRLQFGQIGFLRSASAVLLSKQLICLGLIWARRGRVRLETRENSRIISACQPKTGLQWWSLRLFGLRREEVFLLQYQASGWRPGIFMSGICSVQPETHLNFMIALMAGVFKEGTVGD